MTDRISLCGSATCRPRGHCRVGCPYPSKGVQGAFVEVPLLGFSEVRVERHQEEQGISVSAFICSPS